MKYFSILNKLVTQLVFKIIIIIIYLFFLPLVTAKLDKKLIKPIRYLNPTQSHPQAVEYQCFVIPPGISYRYP